MPLKLSKREIDLGDSINTRTQKHGSEKVTAFDVPLKNMALSKEELCEVCLNPRAYRLLYSRRKGRPDQPIWGKLVDSFHLRGKITGVSAVLYLGRRQLRIADATLKTVFFETPEGGTALLSGTLQFIPDLDENHPIIDSLFSRLGQKIDVQLECESYGAQPELPLEEDEEEDPDEEEEDEDGDNPERGSGFAENARQRRALEEP